MAAMSTYPSCVKNVPDCDDIDTVLQCLLDLGCKISITTDGSVYVDPFPRNNPVPTASLDFRDSLTCCKITTALAATQGFKASCTGSLELQRNRLLPLTSRMAIRGVKFSNFSLPFEMEGRLEGGDYLLDSQDGEQNISALLMSLPLCLENSTIKVEGEIPDPSFIDTTIKALNDFGIIVEKIKDGFAVPGKQIYKTPGEITVESDWPLSCMWLMAGAASGETEEGVTITGLTNRNPIGYQDLQPLLSLISQNFKSLNFNAKHCPDMACVLAAMAIVKGSSVEISGVTNLKNKETNRLKALADVAMQMGQKATITDDSLIIEGIGEPNYEEDVLIDCHDDPWVFMSMAVASSVAKKPYCLKDEGGADKTYRTFFQDYLRLGGHYQII